MEFEQLNILLTRVWIIAPHSHHDILAFVHSLRCPVRTFPVAEVYVPRLAARSAVTLLAVLYHPVHAKSVTYHDKGEGLRASGAQECKTL